MRTCAAGGGVAGAAGNGESSVGASRGKWAKRLGAAAFCFFLIKGLAWLAVPAVLAAWAVR